MSYGSRTSLRLTALAGAAAYVIFLTGAATIPPDGVQAQEASAFWIVPAAGSPGANSDLARAIAAIEDDRPEDALRVLPALTGDPVLGGFALLYKGRAELALDRHDAAAATALELIATDPRGQLGEDAGWLAIEAADEQEDWETVLRVAQALTADPYLQHPGRANLRLGLAAARRGATDRAVEALQRVRYDYPLTAEAREASAELTKLLGPRMTNREHFDRELNRAMVLFERGRFSEARDGFSGIQALATGEAKDLIELRLAVCDFQLGRVPEARTALNDYVHDNESPARVPEARFYFLSAQRVLREHADYIRRVGEFVEMYPDSPFAAQALDELGTHYILTDDDALAAATFLDLYERYPSSPEAARAAWKSGWWDYKQGEYSRAIRTFESAFETFATSNYRPSWLYWAARSHLHLGEREAAEAAFARVIDFYRNSYYGREAARELEGLRASTLPAPGLPVAPASRTIPATVVPGDPPPQADLIRRMLEVGLYDDAVLELRRQQRAGGASPILDATIAWALGQTGELRPSINTMRRAYPEFMAAGGEALPVEVRQAIFPYSHWDLIRTQANAHDLDPYMVLALIAQESTFQEDVRSPADAYGLMQIIPGTGRRMARTLGISSFNTSMLVQPEINVRMGMRYFSELLAEFGDPAPALASYNAGEHRVRVWLAERRGMARDEFVDDIPFPETQNYVKRILGTAEDYRVLYPELSPAHARSGGR